MVAFWLVIIGGINWLLLALIGWEVGSLLGGMDSMLSKIVYILVGLSAVYLVVTHKKSCKECSSSMSGSAGMM